MDGRLKIALEPAKALPAEAEASLLRDALTKNPTSAILRGKLGNVLNLLDRFDDTIELLSPSLGTLDCESAMVLARACFALRDLDHLELAGQAAHRARSTARSQTDLARVMADQAKVQLRRGDSAAAIALLHEALGHDVHCVTAFKRLATQLLRQGEAGEVARLTDELISDGVRHTRVFAARTMALAAIGRDEEARDVVGIDRNLHRSLIAPPTGHDILAHFNNALATELTSSAAIRRDRFGTASLRTGRLDAPGASDTPLWTKLLEQVARAAECWANALPLAGHPWLAARPERALLRSWCVITGAEGHERWHIHPDGWLSGGYYPIVPKGLCKDGDKPGCIAFGLPDGLPGADAAKRFGEVPVVPEEGEITLFPSHAYHRTYPHGKAAQRICVAFDIIPV